MGAADTATTNIHNTSGNGAHSAADSLHQAGDTVSAKLTDAGHAVSQTPDQVKAKTAGNPLAAGLIAFGAGLLVSSLIPASRTERETADQLKTAAQPLAAELSDAAKNVAQDLKQPAQKAMENVKATATDAAQNVKAEGQQAADDVKDRATDAKDNVQNA